MCVYPLQKEHICADLYVHAKKFTLSKRKREIQNNWPKLLVTVTWGAGSLELSVKKVLSFCGLSGSSFNSQPADFVHLPKVRASDVRKLLQSPRSELWTSVH